MRFNAPTVVCFQRTKRGGKGLKDSYSEGAQDRRGTLPQAVELQGAIATLNRTQTGGVAYFDEGDGGTEPQCRAQLEDQAVPVGGVSSEE